MKKLLIIAAISLISMNSYATPPQMILCPLFITCKNSVCTWGYAYWHSRTGPITSPKNGRYELKKAYWDLHAKGTCYYLYRANGIKTAWLDSNERVSATRIDWNGWKNRWVISKPTASCTPLSWATPQPCPFIFLK